MTGFAWWQRGVIYQIYPRSFKDSKGNGIGDLQGIIDKLDYLNDGTERSLGVDSIWISPFYPSPMADFGYDIMNYTDVDPLFGDLATFDKLVAEAHKRDIKVIIDYVPNHSSNQHPWFLESRSSRDNPKHDWYIWRDAKPDGSPPNNWGSVFGGPAWTWDETRQQYYFHQFAVEQPDLNWRNPVVRQTMLDVLRFWLDRDVDGFRMDVVYMIWKHPDMPDQPMLEDVTGRGEEDIYGRQAHIYDYNYEGIHKIIKTMRRVIDEYDNRLMIGEIWLSREERMKYYGENDDEFHMPFNFDFIAHEDFLNPTVPKANLFREQVEAYEEAVPEGGWPNYVLGNHDVSRLASRMGSEAKARVVAMMLLTLRGTPTLYMGDELGITNGDIPVDRIQDPQGKNLGAAYTRDISRTPMQWEDSRYAGFSTAEPWLPVSADYPARNVATLDNQPDSILNLYRRLVWYRRQHDSLAIGDYQSIESPEGTYVYLRQHANESHVIALNFTDSAKHITLPSAGAIALSTNLTRPSEVVNTITLEGEEGVIVQLEDSSNVDFARP